MNDGFDRLTSPTYAFQSDMRPFPLGHVGEDLRGEFRTVVTGDQLGALLSDRHIEQQLQSRDLCQINGRDRLTFVVGEVLRGLLGIWLVARGHRSSADLRRDSRTSRCRGSPGVSEGITSSMETTCNGYFS